MTICDILNFIVCLIFGNYNKIKIKMEKKRKIKEKKNKY